MFTVAFVGCDSSQLTTAQFALKMPGFVLAGAPARGELVVVNTGSRDLRIDSFDVSCGCTTLGVEELLLMPGQSATVDIGLHASNTLGAASGSIVARAGERTLYRGSFSVEVVPAVPLEVAWAHEIVLPLPADYMSGLSGARCYASRNSDVTYPCELDRHTNTVRIHVPPNAPAVDLVLDRPLEAGPPTNHLITITRPAAESYSQAKATGEDG